VAIVRAGRFHDRAGNRREVDSMRMERRSVASYRCGLFSLVLSTAVFSGCGDADTTYPVSMAYPVRSDLIVQSIPKLQPTKFNSPGHLPLDFMYQLPRRYDPAKRAKTFDYAKIEAQTKAGTLKLDENEKALIEESKTNLLDPRILTEPERKKFEEVLTKLFGTPANPTVRKRTGDDELGFAPEFIDMMKLDDATLKEGSLLYRRHCLHCHGMEGNGRGATASWVNPHPRDYRQGVFKFTSSTQDLGQRKPRRDDLMNVLVYGIEGSSMPSFGMYDRKDLDKIISYVIHLSLRGQIEYLVMGSWLNNSLKLPQIATPEDIEAVRASMQSEGKSSAEIQAVIDEIKAIKPPTPEEQAEALKALEKSFTVLDDNPILEIVSGWWKEAQEMAIVPDKYPYPDTEEALLQSAARGAALFNTGTASCVSCHKNYGREAPYYFDAWATIVRPRDLVNGYYRGGRRPIDMYNRVWSGIAGSGMASYDKELRPTDEEKAKNMDRMWDLVNFMQVLHYPDLRAKLKAPPYNIAID
jgi:mono/diheme cytochrome c family protein